MGFIKSIGRAIMDVVNFIESLFVKSERKPPRPAKQTRPVEATRELTKRLEETKKAPAPPKPPKQILPLKIRSEHDWNDFKKKLCKLDAPERFVAKNFAEWKWFAKSLDKVKQDISKMTPQDFNEYTTEEVVTATVNMSKKFLAALDSCGRTIKNPTKDSTEAKELSKLISEYLLGIGIRPMNFKVGDDYDEWADLEMSETPIIEGTNDRKKHNTLKEIYVQPHFIEYLDEHDKKARRVFGGLCATYAFRG